MAVDDPDLLRVAEEFDLGTPTDAERLSGGGPSVTKLATTRGTFVVKPAYRAFEIELYASVEQILNARGIRQARLFRTTTGAVVGSAGVWVQEFVPGVMYERPTRAQADAAMRHLAAYDEALATVDVPTDLDTADTVWTRVVSPTFLAERLPGLVDALGPRWLEPEPVRGALELLAGFTPALADLPRQLVHGDIGPDNVLHEYEGDGVVAILDFTPFHAPVLFGLGSAMYWYHVHPVASGSVDLAGMRSGLAAYDERRPFTAAERALVAPTLLREALRRLATPLAAAEASAEPLNESATRHRYDALLQVLRIVHAGL